jgi:hypothetical protein
MYFIKFYYEDINYFFYFDEDVPVAASKKEMVLDIIKYEFQRFCIADIQKIKALLNTLNENVLSVQHTHNNVFKGIFHMLENPVLQGFCGFELTDEDEYDQIIVTINLDSNLLYNDDFELPIIS